MAEKAQKKEKKGFKMPNSFTILFIITAVIALLTWIIPAGAYDTNEAGEVLSGTYHAIASNPQGLWDVLAAPFNGMLGKEGTDGAIQISLFILTIGGFLAVVQKTGAIDAGIASLIRKFRNNISALIWILMFVFALGGSTYGMAEETIPFFILLIPIMVSVGMDSIVAVSVVLLGSGVGVLASTVNPFATGIASAMAGISMAEGMWQRLVFFVVMYLIAAIFTSRYAKKVQADERNSVIYDRLEADRKKFKVDENIPDVTPKQKTILVLFFITFILMIIGLIPWTKLSENLTIFQNIHEAVSNIPILRGIIGQGYLPFGDWYFLEITTLFFAMSIVVAMIWGMSEEEYVQTFIDGTKDLMSVALICAIARGIQVVMNDGHMTATVLHWGEQWLSGLSKGVFITLTYIFYIPMSFLIPSTSGLAAATMGIMAPLGQFAGVAQHLVITAYQAASGIVNLITPTSGVVMGGLAVAGLSISTWWKYMGKILAVIFVASIILLVIFAMI